MATDRLIIVPILLLLPLPLAASPGKTGKTVKTVTKEIRPVSLRAVSILHRPGMFRLVHPPAARKPTPSRRPARRTRKRTRQRRRVGWGAGEQMTYSVMVAGVEAGRAALSVGRPRTRKGVRTLSIRGFGETNPFISTFLRVKEELITLVNLAGLLPLRASSNRESSNKQRKLATSFGSKQVLQKIERPGRTYQRRRIIAGPRFDPISTLYALRSVRLSRGARLRLRMLSGATLYRLELRVLGEERIYTTLGPRDALRVGGVALRITDHGEVIKGKAPRKVSLWLSADRRRIPLRLVGDTKLGVVQADISSYRPPRSGLTVEKPAF